MKYKVLLLSDDSFDESDFKSWPFDEIQVCGNMAHLVGETSSLKGLLNYLANTLSTDINGVSVSVLHEGTLH